MIRMLLVVSIALIFLATGSTHGQTYQQAVQQSPSASAIDLGSSMALLLSASIGGTESEVMQMYTIAREHASALSLTLPLPPTGPLEDRMAEGLLFSIDTARNINQALVREHGERVAASFMLSFSALTANTFSVNENLRETMVNNAVQAAHVLNLPIEFVQGVIQSIESSDDDSGFQIYRMMNDLKGRQ